MKTRLYYKN